MKRLKFILLFLNIVVVVLTLLSCLSPYINPQEMWYFSFFGLAFIYLVLLNIIFIVLWIFIDIKKVILSLLVLLVSIGQIRKTVAFSFGNDKKDQIEKTVKVMSYNLNQGMYLHKNKKKSGALARYINKQNAGILLVQELNSRNLNEVKKKLNFKYKYTEGSFGAGIYSNYKIVNKGLIKFGSLNTNSCLWADIKISDDTVRVYSVHFMSNHISQKAEELVAEMEKKKNLTSGKIKDVLRNYKKFVRKRVEQVEKVKKHVENSPYPVILGGDFNDPPVSYTYNRFPEILKDAFLEKGWGLGITYAGTVPLLRIDYILVSKPVRVYRFRVDKTEQFSDHYPVIARVGFAKNVARRRR